MLFVLPPLLSPFVTRSCYVVLVGLGHYVEHADTLNAHEFSRPASHCCVVDLYLPQLTAVILICISRSVGCLFTYLKEHLCPFSVFFSLLFLKTAVGLSLPRRLNFGCCLSYKYLFVICSLFGSLACLYFTGI